MAKATKSAAKKGAAKRTTIAPKGDKRFIRRDENGQIKESDDVGRSLSQDRKRASKTAAKRGQGDKGDAPKKTATKKSGTGKTAAKKSAAKKSTATKGAAKKSAAKKRTQ